ncbi:MAG TPA: porin [Herbaspirillum sp.]|jgi:predicted porin
MQFKKIGIAFGAATVSVLSILAAGNAAAQTTNVTVYGIVDAGLEVINNAGTTADHANTLERVSSGNLSGSRIGFRGTEDLGGGLSAVFELEGGIGVDTGTSLQSNRIFGRHAFVGLQGSWGSLLVGRQESLQLNWMSKYNTMDNATWSSKVHDGSFSDRLDNAVKYTAKITPSLTAATYYSTGYDSTVAGSSEVAGSFKTGRQFGGGVQYSGDTLRLAVVADQKNGQSVATAANTDKHLTFGARYKIGAAEMMGGILFRKQENLGTPDIRTNMYWFGGTYQVTAPIQLSASVYHTDVKNSDQDPWSFITMVKYSLSKRTDLYLINSYVMNEGGSQLGVNGFSSSIAPGHNQFGTMAGVRHTF